MKYLVSVILTLLLISCDLVPHAPNRVVYHLGIGISYRGTDVQPLAGPVNDAIGLKNRFATFFSAAPFSSLLLLQMGDEFGGYDQNEANLPTKKRVNEAIEELLNQLQKDDLLILTYSGHGLEGGSLVLAPDRSDGLLLGGDLETSLLSVHELIALFDECIPTVLLILDCCYAGSFIPQGTELSTIESTKDNLFTAYQKKIERNPRLFVLAATTSDNTSKEPRVGSPIHGYFTKALLEALETISKQVTLDQIYYYIHEHQSLPTEGTSTLFYQHPVVSSGPLDLVLRYSTSPRSIR